MEHMDIQPIIDFLEANPLYAVGGAIFLLFLIYSLVKKAIKLVVIAIILNLAYGYYLADMANEFYSKASNTVEDVRQKAEDIVEDAEDALRK